MAASGGVGLRVGFVHGGRLAGVIGTCLAVLLAACAVGPSTPAAVAPTVDTSKLVLAASDFGKQTWEPWLGSQGETVAWNAITEKLVDTDPKTGALRPMLAESWSVSPDSKTWTFKLRANVPFHDGYGNVTAEDVKFSWAQFTQKDSTQNAAPPLLQAVDGKMDNFKIIGPLEFTVTTSKPLVTLPAALSTALPDTMNIQSKKYWETKPAEAKVHPIGTGPYKFVSSTAGVEAVIEAVPNHWRQTATFKQVVLKIIQDDAARFAQVASGAIDATQLPPKLIGEAKSRPSLRLFSIKDTGNIHAVFGGMWPGHANYDRKSPWIQADEPAKGIAIRQAMSLAIDRKLILDKLLGGYGTLVTAPIGQWPSNPKTVDASLSAPYDPVKAKQMLAQGGYPNGFDVTVPIFPWQTQTVSIDIAEAMAGMFEAIGLKVKRQVTDYTNGYRENGRNRTSSGLVTVILGSYSPETITSLQGNYMPTSGTARLFDPAISDAVVKLGAEPDAEKRLAITRNMLATLNREMTIIPLFTNDAVIAFGQRVGSWEPVYGVSQFTNIQTMRPPK